MRSRHWLVILAILYSGTYARAQSPVTVTGTVTNPAGGLATSGTVVFSLKPTSASILYYISGLNTLAPTRGTCGINGSGQIRNLALSGACLVWGNDVITPGNTTYDVQFFPNGLPSQLIHQLLIGGSSFSFSAPVFAPQVNINPQFAVIYAGPLQGNLTPVAAHVFNLGAAALPFAAVYTDNLFVTNSFSIANLTIPGTLHVVGATTLDSTLLVNGISTFIGNVNMAGTLGVNGLTSVVTLSATGNISTTGSVTATGNITAGGTMGSSGLATFNVGITGGGDTGTIHAGTGILGTVNTFTVNQAFTTLSVTGQITSTLATGTAPFAISSTTPVLNLTAARHALIEYCGATSGATQACAKTVQTNSFEVFGDVTLNTAATQSITTLPFTTNTYACVGSDLTTPTGIVSFNTYAIGSVVIQESGGVNTDHLRYHCVGV